MSNNEIATLYVLRAPLLRHKGLSQFLNVKTNKLQVAKLRRAIRPFSHGEQLLAKVALSLWNADHRINLYELGCVLSGNNMLIVINALLICAGLYQPTLEEMGYQVGGL